MNGFLKQLGSIRAHIASSIACDSGEVHVEFETGELVDVDTDVLLVTVQMVLISQSLDYDIFANRFGLGKESSLNFTIVKSTVDVEY